MSEVSISQCVHRLLLELAVDAVGRSLVRVEAVGLLKSVDFWKLPRVKWQRTRETVGMMLGTAGCGARCRALSVT